MEGAFCGFADDTFVKRIESDGAARTAFSMLEADNQLFDKCMDKGGWVQNVQKRDIVPALRGKQANKALARLLAAEGGAKGAAVASARHLGGLYSSNHSAHRELQKRLRAMSAGRAELGAFWFSRVPRSLVRSVFVPEAVESGQSGLTSYVFSAAQFAQLDGQVCGWLRAMLKGGACSLADNGQRGFEASAMKNLSLLKKWGLLPARFEAGVRLFRWLQQCTLRPGANKQVVGAVWGVWKVGEESFSVLDQRGHLLLGCNRFALAFEGCAVLRGDQWHRGLLRSSG